MNEEIHEVSVVNCPNYSQKNVDKAVNKAINLVLTDKKIELNHNSKVLIKPNILSAKKPEIACTTHPAVIEAICKLLAEKKCKIMIGESSGWNTMHGFEVSGIKAVAEKYNAKIIVFENEKSKKKKIKGVILEELKITSVLDEIDYVINVPKMKTHSLMKITGAVKNCYGFIPGLQKAMYHTKGRSETTFGELLIDIYSECKDKILINIMDAVIGMEGEGPGNGEPKNTGLIIASTNAVALDVVQSRIMGFNPEKIKSTTAAVKRKLINPLNIRIIGDYDSSSIPNLKYKPAGNIKNLRNIINTLKSIILRKPLLIPEVNKDKCIKCNICAKLCPVHCITLKPYPLFDRKICIKCYCCQEHCPKGAIFLKR